MPKTGGLGGSEHCLQGKRLRALPPTALHLESNKSGKGELAKHSSSLRQTGFFLLYYQELAKIRNDGYAQRCPS